MKKFISLFLAAAMILSLCGIEVLAYRSDILYGDVDGDDDVDDDDVVLLRKYCVGKVELDERAKEAADINGNGEPDIGDIMSIRRYLINGEWDWPIPEFEGADEETEERYEEVSADDLYLYISYNSYNNDYAEITLRASNSNADIYYTTNGEEATENSEWYSGTFTVYEDTTVNAIAIYGDSIAEISDFDITFKEDDLYEEDEYTDYDYDEDFEDFDYDFDDYDFTEFECIMSPWAEDEVKQAYMYGLIPEEMLDEDLTQQISRDRFAAVAVKLYEGLSGRAAETIPITRTGFTDCYDRSIDKYNPYIGAAYLLDITNGIAEHEFGPDLFINREQLATMLCRAVKKVYFDGWSLNNDSYYELDARGAELFDDDYRISDYAKPSVYYMSKHGIIKGVSDGVFAPSPINVWDETGTATKEQAIVMSLRAYEEGEKLSPDYEKNDEDDEDDYDKEALYMQDADKDWDTDDSVFDNEEEEIIFEPSEDAKASGKCGDNVIWEYYDEGLLVIKGKGKMNNMAAEGSAPWGKSYAEVSEIVVENGVTSIGKCAFTGMIKLGRVKLPDTITEIGDYAFSGCKALEKVDMPSSVRTLGHHAFYNCSSLSRISVPYGIKEIERQTFSGCESISDIGIPSSVIKIGANAFSKCSKLVEIIIPKSVIEMEGGEFIDCASLADIYYGGSEVMWQKISKGSGYDPILTKVHCSK